MILRVLKRWEVINIVGQPHSFTTERTENTEFFLLFS